MASKTSASGIRILRAIEGEGESQKTEDFEVYLSWILVMTLGERRLPPIFRSLGAYEQE
jgi:hypothetical protein